MVEPGSLKLVDPAATEAAGARLARAVLRAHCHALVVYLHGDLGAGKTTLVRGFLRALGHGGRVPSPTYTLVEPYEVAGLRICHVDLYRIRDAFETDQLGLDDHLAEGALALIEWPEQGMGHLPAPDIRLRLTGAGDGRELRLEAATAVGRGVLAGLGPEVTGDGEPSA